MAARSALVLAASVLLLAGCTPAPPMPKPLTDAQVQQLVDDRNAQWWSSMFPDEPQPDVQVIEYLTASNSGTQVTQCMKDAAIPGMEFGADGSWSFSGDAAGSDATNRQMFICSLEYPYDPAFGLYLSDEESQWVWNYNKERLVPCLRMLGYAVPGRAGDYVVGSNNYWIPYYEMDPMPSGAAEWARIDLRCPPSPVGPVLRPNSP